MCDIRAFDPTSKENRLALLGLPGFGKAIGSPQWIKKHPKEAVTAAAIAATVFTGGAAAGVWGGGEAAAAGAGTAGAELAAEDTALGLGAGAAGAGASGAATAAAEASPGVFGASASANPITSGLFSSVGNMGSEQAGMLAAQNEGFGAAGINSTLQAANPQYASLANGLDKLGTGLDYGNKAMKIANLVAPQQPQIAAPPPSRPQPRAGPEQSNMDILNAGRQPQPGDPGYLEYLRKKQYGY